MTNPLYLWKHPDEERYYVSTACPSDARRQWLRDDGYRIYKLTPDFGEQRSAEYDAESVVAAVPEGGESVPLAPLSPEEARGVNPGRPSTSGLSPRMEETLRACDRIEDIEHELIEAAADARFAPGAPSQRMMDAIVALRTERLEQEHPYWRAELELRYREANAFREHFEETFERLKAALGQGPARAALDEISCRLRAQGKK